MLRIHFQPHTGNPALIQIFIDDRFWRQIPKALYIKYLSNKHNTLTQNDLQDVLGKYEKRLCMDQALRFLALRGHFAEELSKKLLAKGYDPAVIKEVIEACSAQGYIDDAEHLKGVIRRELQKGNGPRLIALKLQSIAKLPSDQIKALLDESEKLQDAALAKSLQKRRQLSHLMDAKQKLKLYRALIQKGFSREKIEQALND